jgi:uncharacterized membrane-anchored protein YitT (DUF2179 family)
MKKFDWPKLFYTLISSTIYSLGVVMFLNPANTYSGGVAGSSQLIVDVFSKYLNIELNVGILVFIFNIPFLVLAYFGISKKYCLFTSFSVIIQTVMLGFLPDLAIANVDRLTNAIIGGLVCGLGIALALRWGTSTGSLDVLAQYYSFKKGISVGNMTLAVNCSIALLAGILLDPTRTVYTIIRIVLNAVIIDKIHTSYNSVQIHIITKIGDDISQALIKEIRHTVTKLECVGQYQHEKKDFLEIIVSKYEVQKTINIVKQMDEKAFIYTSYINKIYGNFKKRVID